MAEHDTQTAQIKEAKERLDVEHIESNELDADAQRLQDLGYKQEFKREISLFVQAGFSFTTMAVMPNWLVGFGGSMAAGGPSSLFWGWIVVIPFVTCIALSMAEVISAYPLAGGVYSWSYLLSSKKWGPLMSWINGYVYLIGLVTANITLAYTSADFIFGISNMLNVTQITSQGAYVGLYCGIFIMATLYNMLGMKFSSYMNKFMVVWCFIGSIIIICACPAMAPSHKSAKWVFTEFANNTGYSNSGLVFFLGLLQAGWTLVGYECGAQIVEGTKNANRTAPRGIIICIISAIVQGFVLIIAVLFSIQDVEALQESSMPIATFFEAATNAKVATFFLVILLIVQLGSLCNSILATAHVFWAMSRDGCLPFSSFLYKLSDKNHIPYNALIVQMVISIAVIMPTFGSEVYWSAVMSAAVISINVSYGIPFLCRIIWTRNNMEKGPFDLGRFSVPLNIISIIWICFFGIILCFPSIHPVDAQSMNYASLMIGGILVLSLGFWFAVGHKRYTGPVQTAE